MQVYRIKTLSELILELKRLPAGTFVRGFNSSYLHSDRGYYERAALEPRLGKDIPVHAFATSLEAQIGNIMQGWKGGRYTISGAKPVAFAEEGNIGPYIAGFALADGTPHVYGPVLIEEQW